MLIRRLKERCAAPNLVHVGTSATMVASPDATPESRRATVADFASRLFGQPFTAGQVIEETLVTFTAGGLPSREELAAVMTGQLPDQLEDFRRHPLARWVEREFGVEPEEGGDSSAAYRARSLKRLSVWRKQPARKQKHARHVGA